MKRFSLDNFMYLTHNESMRAKASFILWFSDVEKDDKQLVGERGVFLGEMTKAGFFLPKGFIISSKAYFSFLAENNLATKINSILAGMDVTQTDAVMQASARIKKLILDATIPERMISEIRTAYKSIGNLLKEPQVLVRASLIQNKDLVSILDTSIETVYTIAGDTNLMLTIKEAYASLFDTGRITHRTNKKINHFADGIAITVQRVINGQLSGMLFTEDPVTNDNSKLVIESVPGPSIALMKGSITPDYYEISKRDFLVENKTYGSDFSSTKKMKKLKKHLSDNDLLKLAETGKKIEKLLYFPQEIEWTMEKNILYITDVHPLTNVQNNTIKDNPTEMHILAKGTPISPGIVSGPVQLIPAKNPRIENTIVVLQEPSEKYIKICKRALAVIAGSGGKSSHVAAFLRSYGVPSVFGIRNIEKVVSNGQIITVNGKRGEIYSGSYLHASASERVRPQRTATKLFAALNQIEQVHEYSEITVDGFFLSHPENFLLQPTHPKKLAHAKKTIYKTDVIDRLDQFLTSVEPKPVLYSLTDLTSDRYKKLDGGKEYEPQENNPLIGYRGAFRAIHDPLLLEHELTLMQTLRNKRKRKNIWVILPFVRSVKELQELKKVLAAKGLYRSPTFKIFMSVNCPENILNIESYLKIGIDGLSMNADILSSLVLGIDNENLELAHIFNPADNAIVKLYELCIHAAHKQRLPIYIHGESVSRSSDLLEKLVQAGVSGITVPIAMIGATHEIITDTETRIITRIR